MGYGRLAVCALAVASTAHAQSLESRIANAKGSVAFEYTTRPTVCGRGNNINIRDRGDYYDSYGGCRMGPARVLLQRDGSTVTSLNVTVASHPDDADTELGEVLPSEASKYLLSIAPKLQGRSGDRAILAAEIAEGGAPWRELLRIARDDNASESARKASVFWVSQEAEEAATAGLGSIAADDDSALSVRKDSLFFLAQRPHGEGIPALVKVVESSKSVALKKDAIFFLAQSRDDRALALFERLLSGK